MKQIAILTDFIGEPDPAYSLCRVASNQMKALLRAGYKPILIADQTFRDIEYPWNEARELRFLPGLPRWNVLRKHDTWGNDLQRMIEAMRKALEGVDVVLSHDLIYQPAQILHNIAARKIAEERPEIKWLHLIHSATTPAVLSSDAQYLEEARKNFPNSKIMFPNAYSTSRVARNFNFNEDNVVCVPHAIDWCKSKKYEEETTELIDDKSMLQADVIGCYPARLDRGKQVEWPIRIFASIKRFWKSVRLVIVDFHSTGGDKVHYRKELRNLADSLGLSQDELIFTSQYRPEWNVRVPHEVVTDLFDLSNVFVLPSRSETFSLIAQEAATSRNLLILNQNFPPMRNIYKDWPLYYQFGANIDAMTGFDGDTNVTYKPSPDNYAYDIASRIVYEITHNRILAEEIYLRKEHNLDSWVKNYLEPLLYSWD